MRLSRRQGLQLMLGAAQAVFVGAAGCVAAGYAKIVTGRSGGAPLAHWRCSDSQDLFDEQPGARHGVYTGTPSLVSGLPTDSDQALSFPGGVHAEVADDAGLHLAEFSISGWLKVTGNPSSKIAVWSKDASGLNDGDFALTIDDSLTLGVQFQSASSQFVLETDLTLDTAYHWCVLAGAFGFDFFVNGKHIGRNTGFTGGWANNENVIQFANAPWAGGEELVGVLDEVALYDYALTDADVIALSQVTATPTAGPISQVVTENQTLVIDVAAQSQYVGRKANLTVEVSPAGADTWGSSATSDHSTSITVNADNDVEFAADEVTQDEVDSFDYRITDANGTSAAATVSMTVQDQASGGEGTLVYQWAPLASWIDGVALSNRDWNEVTSLSRWTDANAATVGASLPKEIQQIGGQVTTGIAYNRAPTGEPSIEIRTGVGDDAPMLFNVRLYDIFQGTPRHLRCVWELKTCKASDPTDHKGQGLGTTTGSYPDWNASHNFGEAAGKYFVGQGYGNRPGGGGGDNWWNDPNQDEDQGSARMVWGQGATELYVYSYHFDRSSAFGGGRSDNLLIPVETEDSGVAGVWHRVEVEVKLCTPQLAVDANARRADPPVEPDHIGDGFVKLYVTKDIDGELGAPGTRELIAHKQDIITFPYLDAIDGTADDLHLDTAPGGALLGPWFCLIYGGAGGTAKAEAWAWIRKVEVYRQD